MLLLFRRMLTYFTLVACLVVGAFVVRTLDTVEAELTFDARAYRSLTKFHVAVAAEPEVLKAPQQVFASINFEKPKKIIVPKKNVQVAAREARDFDLPFHEPITIAPVYMEAELPADLVALYRSAPQETVQQDEVMMAQAAPVAGPVEEPVFFEYEEESAKETEKTEKVAKAENEDLLPTAEMRNEKSIPVSEEVSLGDLVAFDYSKAKEDISKETVPAVTTNYIVGGQNAVKPQQLNWEVKGEGKKGPKRDNQPGPLPPQPNPHKMMSYTAVTAVGTDLGGNAPQTGFEVRFHDDYSEMQEDHGGGEVLLENNLAQTRMTRAIRVLKRGFVPTNTDLVLEKSGGSAAIPLLDEEKYNELHGAHEPRGPMGAVLVELDDDTELAQLDVPFAEVILLDGDLRVTKGTDHRYQLFTGVRAGNAMLLYKRHDKLNVSKIIHVHERELTFDNNFFEPPLYARVKLLEENLLSKTHTPLVIASEQVRLFATDKTSSKLSNQTFSLDFGQGIYGGRRHLELNHQSEPVFVGIRNSDTALVPSEGFMRHVLAKAMSGNMGNRCLIQVNLRKKIQYVEVGAQSVDDTLMTSVQMLDADGMFYDSVSDKTMKIIVLGESHASGGQSPDGKINLKIDYLDGSVEYLSTYCSPNTYMVEQL